MDGMNGLLVGQSRIIDVFDEILYRRAGRSARIELVTDEKRIGADKRLAGTFLFVVIVCRFDCIMLFF